MDIRVPFNENWNIAMHCSSLIAIPISSGQVLGVTLTNLGNAFGGGIIDKSCRYKRADCYDRALQIKAATHGPDHMETAMARFNYALLSPATHFMLTPLKEKLKAGETLRQTHDCAKTVFRHFHSADDTRHKLPVRNLQVAYNATVGPAFHEKGYAGCGGLGTRVMGTELRLDQGVRQQPAERQQSDRRDEAREESPF